MNDLLKMDLQLFADDEGGSGDAANPDGENKKPESTENQTNPEESKKYSDKDVNDIINAKFAKWQKEQDEKIKAEAKKAKMSEQEKIEAEKSELEKKLEEFERREKIREQAKNVSASLEKAELPHDDDLIELLAEDNENDTKAKVDVLIAYAGKIKKKNTVTGKPNDGGQFNTGSNDSKSKKEMAKKNRII